MQQTAKMALLKINKDNYKVPKGQEQYVHYKLALIKDEICREVRLVKTDVKLFDAILRNYELSGYTVEILHHPLGKYTNVRIPVPVEELIAEKNAEIAALKAQIQKHEAANGTKEPDKTDTTENNGDADEKPTTDAPDYNEGAPEYTKPKTTKAPKAKKEKKEKK